MSDIDTNTTRRQFIADTSRATAGLVAAGALTACAAPTRQTAPVPRRVLGANERMNIAVIGIRSRGMQLAKGFAGLPNVHVKTLVDPDENLFADRVAELAAIQGAAPGKETDLRRAFDDKDIDAVVIATPDHWHALATIWACQAGKDVYVEKPCCHNIWEGRKMVEAARRYDRIVAVGFQNRSIMSVRAAMRFLHKGGIGEVFMARGLCFKPRDSIGRHPDGPVPAGVNYDLWLGAAPQRPFNRNRFHYEWHWNWDFGCGDIGNQGPHQFDIARWGLNESEHPVRISSSGGYFAWDSDQQTPNTQAATLEYADGKLLYFEVRGLYTNHEDGIRIGNLFYGTEGWMHLDGGNWKTYFGRKNEPGPNSENAEEYADPSDLAGAGGGSHFANFISAVRAGDCSKLTCDIEEGFISTALPHLSNIAYRVGHDVRFDGTKERFIGDRDANRLLTRDYRKPYVVPKEV
ncbi:MAG: Gfo/Idh/MocA family oxidoreductase [Phycisphaerales bacterium]|nr:Gfo/Idh/MocA family oxidoreductase [Phycisphaerales bacterium]